MAGHADSIARAAQLGVTLLCGSDAGGQGVPHGAGLLDEMVLLAATGTPMETILRGATSAPRSRWGEAAANLVPGAPFDAVALTQSPFETAAALRSMSRILSTDRRAAGSAEPVAVGATPFEQVGGDRGYGSRRPA